MFQPTSTPNQIRFVSQKSDNNLQRKEKAAFEGFFNPLLAVRRVPNPKDYNTNLYFFQKLHSLKSTELLVHLLKEDSKSAISNKAKLNLGFITILFENV